MPFQPLIDHRLSGRQMIGSQCEDGLGPPDPLDFAVEAVEIESVYCGPDSGQIDATGPRRGLFGRFHTIGNAIVLFGLLQLLLTGIGGEHIIKVLDQRDRRLPIASTKIPCSLVRFGASRQLLEQPSRIARKVLSIWIGMIREMAPETHRLLSTYDDLK